MQCSRLVEIIQEVFPKTGEEFFQSMSATLCDYFECQACFVSLRSEGTMEAETIVNYSVESGLAENFAYELKGTPCEDALGEDRLMVIPEGICKLYPDDDLLIEVKAESYVGHCIRKNDKTIGLLILIGLKPFTFKEDTEEIMAIFTERIASELERIDHQKETEELNKKLKLALVDAEEANIAKSRFIANMSHEFRTPLNAILGFGQILQEEIKDEVQVRYLTGIRESGRSLLSLINNILDFAKIEANKLTLTGNDFDLDLFLTSLLEMFRLTAEKKGIDLKLRLPSSLKLAIVTDEGRLRQILMNLVSNAIKFTTEGVVTVSVEGKSVGKDLMDLTFSVTDTGMGVPENNLKKIFTAFEQQAGQSQGMYGGTGLGLSISSKLAKIMNGDLSVESKIGKGSVFSLTLHDLTVMAPTKFSSMNHEISYEFKPAKVLIVDDIALNREVMLGFMKNFPFETQTGVNGQEAIKLAKSFKPDLIITDLKMPVMDGYDATIKIKEFCDTPVIGISASGNPQEKEDFIKVTDAFMYKPVIRKDFMNNLAKFLEHDLKKVEKKQLESRHLTIEQRMELRSGLVKIHDDFEQEIHELELSGLANYVNALRGLAKDYPAEKFIQHIVDIQNAIDGFALDEINIELKRLEKFTDKLIEETA